jgi:hypothetical protein
MWQVEVAVSLFAECRGTPQLFHGLRCNLNHRFVTISNALEVVTKRAFLSKNDTGRRAVSKYDTWTTHPPKDDTRPVCMPKTDTKYRIHCKYDTMLRPHSQKSDTQSSSLQKKAVRFQYFLLRCASSRWRHFKGVIFRYSSTPGVIFGQKGTLSHLLESHSRRAHAVGQLLHMGPRKLKMAYVSRTRHFVQYSGYCLR